MSPKQRAKASDARRRSILDAALDLFLRSGVGGCRIEDLLEKSGASSGSFYHHFGSKQAVAAELYIEILDEFQQGFLAEMRSHRSARAGVKAVVSHHLAWVVENPKRAAFFFECSEPEVFPLCRDRDTKMRRAFLGECLVWLERAAAKGELRKLAPLEFYVLWMGPTLELTRAWLMNNQGKWTWMSKDQCRPESLLSARKTLADAAWHALGSTPPAPRPVPKVGRSLPRS